MEQYKVVTQDYVNIQISTSKDNVPLNEKRYQKGIKIMELKVKLVNITSYSKIINELFHFRTN